MVNGQLIWVGLSLFLGVIYPTFSCPPRLADRNRLHKRQVQVPPNIEPFPSNTSESSAWGLLKGNPSFSNFTNLAILSSPRLVQTLNATGPNDTVTVFAPPNSAFQGLRDSSIYPLLLTNRFQPLLGLILAGHVHNNSAVFLSQVPPAGANLTIDTVSPLTNITLQNAAQRPVYNMTLPTIIAPQQMDQNKTWANDAEIIFGDVVASNGVIQVVDRIITPFFDGSS